MTDIRVRFAPSPTGELHIGGARTALFNWLFARNRGGKMVLRIDDTDKQRSSPEFLNSIITSMKWLGLDWDEGPERGGDYGPYLQSERLDLHRAEAQKLVNEGKAYYCFCTAEELTAEKENKRLQGLPPRYSGKCRYLSLEESEDKKAANSFVIRLLVPEEGETVVEDLIRGPVVFENKIFDDFIIMKSDGLPTYNFASVIDDYKMEITHVIRAEEHLSNTPRQQIIARQLEYKLPLYAHVPMILAPDHSKLSKRHGATSVQEYREMGILPEALINYLALLGWSPGEDREIMNIDEIIDSFSLEKVSKNPAIYDLKKLIWLNGHYLRTIDLRTVVQRVLPFFKDNEHLSKTMNSYQEVFLNETMEKVVDLVRDRVKTLREVVEASDYFFQDDFSYDEKGVEKHFRKKSTGDILNQIFNTLETVEPFQASRIKEELEKLSQRLNVPLAQINLPTRLAITGRTMGPELFDIISFLGRDRVLERLKRAKELFTFA
ncbi:MAG: glutamate--tRNA ligase [Dethiobacter sp.]|jgi:glutamyl-tRNA synthetase|nr:MAG: glutamate--tRNA ligase [Dethiobacter sp.]